MATDMATTIDPDPREAALDVEYPIQLAYTREPMMCLAGTVSVISPGRRDLALSELEMTRAISIDRAAQSSARG
jgi:hypothetical protein